MGNHTAMVRAVGQHRSGQQGQQAHPRHGVGRDRRVHEHVHPAAAGAVQLEDGEQGEQDAAPHAARQGRVGQIQGEHGVGVGGLVENETRRGRDRRQQDHQPGQAAAQQPPQLQGKQPDRFHWNRLPGDEIEVGVLQGGLRRLGIGGEGVRHRPAPDAPAGVHPGGDVEPSLLGGLLLPEKPHVAGGPLDQLLRCTGKQNLSVVDHHQLIAHRPARPQ